MLKKKDNFLKYWAYNHILAIVDRFGWIWPIKDTQVHFLLITLSVLLHINLSFGPFLNKKCGKFLSEWESDVRKLIFHF